MAIPVPLILGIISVVSSGFEKYNSDEKMKEAQDNAAKARQDYLTELNKPFTPSPEIGYSETEIKTYIEKHDKMIDDEYAELEKEFRVYATEQGISDSKMVADKMAELLQSKAESKIKVRQDITLTNEEYKRKQREINEANKRAWEGGQRTGLMQLATQEWDFNRRLNESLQTNREAFIGKMAGNVLALGIDWYKEKYPEVTPEVTPEVKPVTLYTYPGKIGEPKTSSLDLLSRELPYPEYIKKLGEPEPLKPVIPEIKTAGVEDYLLR